jgi:hypothetical protein
VGQCTEDKIGSHFQNSSSSFSWDSCPVSGVAVLPALFVLLSSCCGTHRLPEE